MYMYIYAIINALIIDLMFAAGSPLYIIHLLFILLIKSAVKSHK